VVPLVKVEGVSALATENVPFESAGIAAATPVDGALKVEAMQISALPAATPFSTSVGPVPVTDWTLAIGTT
jgi:hypothetical protein